MDQLPPTLSDILDNTVILRQIAPYLSVAAVNALGRTSRAFHDLTSTQPELWRHLDLTTVRSAIIDSSPIDIGGTSWRAERMDEALTEDEFYSGPLRGIFGRLSRVSLLQHVQILVLDGLSAPADLVRELVCDDRYHVRILSIRECKNLNQRKLQQVLRYAVRPTRAPNTPRLRALYVFGLRGMPLLSGKQEPTQTGPDGGITSVAGAQIGSQWNYLSTAMLSSTLPQDDQEKWYGSSGRILKRPQSDWPETLQACRDLIAFDAVLCRGPRHDITRVSSTDFQPATIATVALGPAGCEICGTCPEGPAAFGQSNFSCLPLLAPPPGRSATIRAAQIPETVTGVPPPLILRCEDCLRGRWCERCNRFWCEPCYTEPVSRVAGDLAMTTDDQTIDGWELRGQGGAAIKVGVHRDCFDCGRTCAECNHRLMRTCGWCSTEYCRIDDTGSTDKMCSWCSHSGRRTRELY